MESQRRRTLVGITFDFVERAKRKSKEKERRKKQLSNGTLIGLVNPDPIEFRRTTQRQRINLTHLHNFVTELQSIVNPYGAFRGFGYG